MWYVSMIDKFMSGWGMAKDCRNLLVISCNTWREMAIVAENARAREEMTDIKEWDSHDALHRYIRTHHPVDYISWHGREQDDYHRWFQPEAFGKALV